MLNVLVTACLAAADEMVLLVMLWGAHGMHLRVANSPLRRELVMIQQQRHGGSLFHQGGRVVGEFGVTTLFRGLFTSCGREGLFTAG